MATVREVIHKLMEEDLDDEVIVKDKDGKHLVGASLYVREVKKDRKMGALFG